MTKEGKIYFVEEPESDESDAERQASRVVDAYSFGRVAELPPEKGNDLSAAKKCGCPSCLINYFLSLDWLTGGDRAVSDCIARSHGIKRPK